MKNRVCSAFFLLLVSGMFFAGVAAAEIRFGTVPRLSAAELQKMYGPLADYLAKETGEEVTIVVPKDFPAFKEAAKNGRMDIAFSNPLLYVEIKDKAKIEPLALSSEVKSGTRLRGIILVRKDSGINNIQDLKGKKFAFMAKGSPAGYLFQLLLLHRAGFDIKKDISILPFVGRHEKIIMSVLDGTADAGGCREDELEKVKGKIDTSKLRIVGYTDYFPNWVFFSTPSIKPGVAAKVRQALLKLKPNDPKNEAIIGTRARLTGFVPVADREYDGLRKAAKVARALEK